MITLIVGEKGSFIIKRDTLENKFDKCPFVCYTFSVSKRKRQIERWLMDRLNHVIEALRQSQHMPALLSLLVGLIVIRKRPWLFFNDDEAAGDNIPASLMDGLKA